MMVMKQRNKNEKMFNFRSTSGKSLWIAQEIQTIITKHSGDDGRMGLKNLYNFLDTLLFSVFQQIVLFIFF